MRLVGKEEVGVVRMIRIASLARGGYLMRIYDFCQAGHSYMEVTPR